MIKIFVAIGLLAVAVAAFLLLRGSKSAGSSAGPAGPNSPNKE